MWVYKADYTARCNLLIYLFAYISIYSLVKKVVLTSRLQLKKAAIQSCKRILLTRQLRLYCVCGNMKAITS